MRRINKKGANTYRRTHADTSQKFANFANFPGFQALTVIQGPMSVSAWIQEVFPTILNLESKTPLVCKRLHTHLEKDVNGLLKANCMVNKRYVRGIVVCSCMFKVN